MQNTCCNASIASTITKKSTINMKPPEHQFRIIRKIAYIVIPVNFFVSKNLVRILSKIKFQQYSLALIQFLKQIHDSKQNESTKKIKINYKIQLLQNITKENIKRSQDFYDCPFYTSHPSQSKRYELVSVMQICIMSILGNLTLNHIHKQQTASWTKLYHKSEILDSPKPLKMQYLLQS
ncbi:unnamed protein product (macronuclear) [Paramecium tetraurelia]|uniref:Transmembrane protein n=1 Tax=Paramecium tetraurelia TaxID=5888 RepID=A0BQ49_PARTE|nr:uncharacterized protein GSPATT00005417001 [Paramecium tetraurelia]CAK60666.1 unnamed protein product [Paramecium tetraurelia]|eukprot:XP_001428064.1 hypothetical protein (macronuclear) [Paramecium tetraurelia strain d4-2]